MFLLISYFSPPDQLGQFIEGRGSIYAGWPLGGLVQSWAAIWKLNGGEWRRVGIAAVRKPSTCCWRDTVTPLEAAYAAYEPGSAGFLAAVDFVGRYQVSKTEARRIALESESAAVWERTWKDESWWRDGEDTGEWL